MRIAEAARKHGVTDQDMRHALANSVRRITMDERFTLLIGPATTGALLEIGVLSIDSDPAIIHAMALRPRFHRYLT